MKNYNFIKLYRDSKESLEGPHTDYRRVHSNIYSLFIQAKKVGFNMEQRARFFNLIKLFNHKVNDEIRRIKRRLRDEKTPIIEHYDESELGAFAGSYIEGYEYNLTYEEKQSLIRSLDWFEYLLISFKGESIPDDTTTRIPLVETEQKIQTFDQIIDDDSVSASSVYINICTDFDSTDDLPF